LSDTHKTNRFKPFEILFEQAVFAVDGAIQLVDNRGKVQVQEYGLDNVVEHHEVERREGVNSHAVTGDHVDAFTSQTTEQQQETSPE
jgi:hypothetical protein